VVSLCCSTTVSRCSPFEVWVKGNRVDANNLDGQEAARSFFPAVSGVKAIGLVCKVSLFIFSTVYGHISILSTYTVQR